MERLRADVTSVMGITETPTRELIRRMPYLASVIKESMHPSSQPVTPSVINSCP